MRHRVAFVILPVLVGCEALFPVVEEGVDGSSDVATSDVAEPDVSTGGDGGDAATDAPNDVAIDTSNPNLVLNPGFEMGTTLCGDDWNLGNNATITFSSQAHTGLRSCLVCSSNPTGVTQTVNVLFDAGVSFAFTAYIATVPEGGAPKGQMDVHAIYLDGGQYFDQTPKLDDGGAWAQYSDPFTTSSAGTSIVISINPGGGGGCILVDDVSLTLN